MIGLVLGETQLGKIIVKRLNLLKKKYTIIDISKRKLFKKDKNSYSLSVGQLGKAISILKKRNCKRVIFAGKVIRPNFYQTRFDFKALYHLAKIIKSSKKGDSYIIKEIIKIFQKEKIKIVNQTYYNPEIILKKGNYSKIKPDIISYKDISLGKKIIKDLSVNNVGQAVVVINGSIIAIEDHYGTNSMLERAKKIIKNGYLKKKKQGILLKFTKSNQDLRIDLPVVGINTLMKCKKLGLKGVVVEANKNIFLDKAKCISFANKNRIFISAV